MDFLESTLDRFRYYRVLGERCFDQLNDEQLFWKPDPEANSIAIIVNHLHGNMLSRWTDFLDTDGEKDWRHRDEEFKDSIADRDQLLSKWNEGWDCLFKALDPLSIEDLNRTVFIRNEGHTVTQSLNRQLAHYAYHIGQIVYISRMLRGDSWKSLSIPKGESEAFNEKMKKGGK